MQIEGSFDHGQIAVQVMGIIGLFDGAVDGRKWGQISQERSLHFLRFRFLGRFESPANFGLLGFFQLPGFFAFRILFGRHH